MFENTSLPAIIQRPLLSGPGNPSSSTGRESGKPVHYSAAATVKQVEVARGDPETRGQCGGVSRHMRA
ncbi:hypothetical protein E2C01_027521 [Portunus trituberculatus]|uniref:Uncharacterized protein n=1 Tax=Portunus trituberculatus TaxID=210409 RepID=A0A5B7EIY3_PORTR|nr:hypothetical protein [Portunus trituberculatus]